uniref:Uncharacterized protein n=1 Tax=Onchocerca volvulus TaxID=6282 RepID=A0A8R1TQS4_ONCVO
MDSYHIVKRHFCSPKMAYVEHTFNVYASFKQMRRHTHQKFENRLKTFRLTIPLIIRFTEYNSFIMYSIYHEGNCRRNQLLDCSIKYLMENIA